MNISLPLMAKIMTSSILAGNIVKFHKLFNNALICCFCVVNALFPLLP